MKNSLRQNAMISIPAIQSAAMPIRPILAAFLRIRP